jgi:acetoacetyl-CoA synthetase
MNSAKPIWTPSPQRLAEAGITRYLGWLERERGLSFSDYESLWQWSVTAIEDFWESIWQFCGVIAHQPYERVLGDRVMPGAKWFQGAQLNYAEHSLAHAKKSDAKNAPAIIHESETRARGEVSWAALSAEVGALGATLDRLGVKTGDRVVAYLPNIPEAVSALLAAASRGAIWSSVSPDMGPTSVLDRFRQIEPKVLFALDGYRYGGKEFDRRETVRQLCAELPSVEAVIFVPYLNSGAVLGELGPFGSRTVRVLSFSEATARPAPARFTPVPFDHPLWIVYSSGTTGMPKPIVHGHGGVVIQSLKAGILHFDTKPGDRNFWFTSTNWIMWNSVVNMLHTGSTIMLFDGNPGYPDMTTLWRFVERERAKLFGTSPAFIAMCMKNGMQPGRQFDLSSLQVLGCTGAPLPEEGYRWILDRVNRDVMIACISGGTDPGACFLTASPMLPTYAGEMACRELGVAVHAFDDAGNPVLDEVGELVLTEPIPSLPLFFWGDTGGKRYFESYFETYPGVWRHGDWLRLVPRAESVTGIIYGRSDSTINRHGIRMGTAEIYRVVEESPDVLDSIVVDLEYLGKESFMALFVVLAEPVRLGDTRPDGEAAGRASQRATVAEAETGVPATLRKQLLDSIRTRLSARHVPNEVFAISDVPRTLSGKKMEVPVKKLLLGQPVEKSANRDSMSNPASLDYFMAFARGRAER